jgi:hypothetical protein
VCRQNRANRPVNRLLFPVIKTRYQQWSISVSNYIAIKVLCATAFTITKMQNTMSGPKSLKLTTCRVPACRVARNGFRRGFRHGIPILTEHESAKGQTKRQAKAERERTGNSQVCGPIVCAWQRSIIRNNTSGGKYITIIAWQNGQ